MDDRQLIHRAKLVVEDAKWRANLPDMQYVMDLLDRLERIEYTAELTSAFDLMDRPVTAEQIENRINAYRHDISRKVAAWLEKFIPATKRPSTYGRPGDELHFVTYVLKPEAK